jgi:hypothetical protein
MKSKLFGRGGKEGDVETGTKKPADYMATGFKEEKTGGDFIYATFSPYP